MKQYRISLGGRGSEVYVFELTNDLYQQLLDGDVTNDSMEHDDICEILGVESYYDCPNETVMGPYPDAFYMKVTDENENVVYDSDEFDYDKSYTYEKYCDDKKYLIIEDYCKGEHVVYNIEIENDFDIEKVQFLVCEIGCQTDIITGLTYDNDNKHELYHDYGDTSSKGYYYNLINYGND